MGSVPLRATAVEEALRGQELSDENVAKAAEQARARGAKLGTQAQLGKTLKSLQTPLFDHKFEPQITTKNPPPGEDILTASSNNYYQGVKLDDLKEFYGKIKAEGQPIDHISDHGISLGIYLRDPDGNGVEVFYEMPRAEWPVDYNVFTREKTGSGRFPGPWDAEIGRDGPPAREQTAAE